MSSCHPRILKAERPFRQPQIQSANSLKQADSTDQRIGFRENLQETIDFSH